MQSLVAALLTVSAAYAQMPSLGGSSPPVNQLYAMEKINLIDVTQRSSVSDASISKSFGASVFSQVRNSAYPTAMSSVAVDPLSNSIYVYAQASATQVSLTKLSSNGTQLWSSVFGSQTFAGDGTVPQPVIDPETGNVFVAGWTRDGFDGNSVSTPSNSWRDTGGGGRDHVSSAYSPELKLMVSVSKMGMTMTSSDIWTFAEQAPSIAGSSWYSVVWSPTLGLFVAVGAASNSRVMTSPNGRDWTGRNTTDPLYTWSSVTWSPEIRMLVAVSFTGPVMTSYDGVMWTLRPHNVTGGWSGITWATELGLFVVVGSGSAVMVSSDGINWASGINVPDRGWSGVSWSSGLRLFVAVGQSGTNRSMTSRDGYNWTLGTTASDQAAWISVVWSHEVRAFVATASNCACVMVSPDGVNWSMGPSIESHGFSYPIFIPQFGRFVSVNLWYRLGMWFPRGTEVGFISHFSSVDGTRLWTRFLPQHYGNIRITSLKQIGNDLLIGGHTQAVLTPGQWDAFLLRVGKTSQYSQVFFSYWGNLNSNERLFAMEIDERSGTIYSVGSTNGNLDGQMNGGGFDIFVSKHRLDNGRRELVRLLGTAGNDLATVLLLDLKRNALYVGGAVADAQQLSAQDQFVAKLSLSDLMVKWSRALGGCGGQDAINSLTIHPLTGNLIAAGQISACFASSSEDTLDATVVVFNQLDGSRIQTIIAGSSQVDSVQSVDFQQDGTLALTGQFNGSAAVMFLPGLTGFVAAIIPTSTQIVTVSLQFTDTISQTIDRSQTIYSTATETSVLTMQSDRLLTETLVAVSSASVSVTQIVVSAAQPVVFSSLVQQAPIEPATLTVVQLQQQQTVSVPLAAPTTVSVNVAATTVTVAPTAGAIGGNNGPSTTKSSDSDNQSNVLIWALVAGGAGILLGMALLFGVMRMRKDRKQEENENRSSLPQRFPETFSANDIYTPRVSQMGRGGQRDNGFSAYAPSFSSLTEDNRSSSSQGSLRSNRPPSNFLI